MHRTLATALIALTTVTAQHHATPRHHFRHHRECATQRCADAADRAWARLHPRARAASSGPTYEGTATYYSPGSCDSTGGGETTALGTHVHFGEVANSVLALGTRIWVEPAILGRHEFTVEDRFGEPLQPVGRLDIFLPCGTTIPNPWERFHVIG